MLNSCIICNKNFKPINGTQKCCSEECSKLNRVNKDKEKYRRHKNKKPEMLSKECPTCGQEFQTMLPYQIFCSEKCNVNRPKENKICCVCAKSFEPCVKYKKCCSEECSKLNRIKYDKAKHARYELEKPKFKKVCLACGHTFETTNQKQVFCSTKCAATKVQNETSIKKCITCGNDYEGKQGNLYCSDACKPKINHTCEQCGKEYKTEGRISKYCSNKCVTEASTKHNAICLNCGKEFTSVSEEPRKFCCRDCFLESIGADKWETKREWELRDASSILRAKKYGVKYEHIIPVEIFKRDNWICRLCGVGVSHSLAYPHPMSASLNHIIPLSKNGTHTTENVQLAHMGCSLRKSNKHEGEMINANINEEIKRTYTLCKQPKEQ